MKNLRRSFDIFCYKHRNWGIPNLMLYVVLGTALVSLITIISGNSRLLELLCFDKASILQGQIWRLFTFIFTDTAGSILSLIFLYFFYMLGRHVEQIMGTFLFNLFYFSGVILMDVFGMIFCPSDPVTSLAYAYTIYLQMGFYLHLSLILMYAATNPDAKFVLFFIIPIPAWTLSIIYLFWILTVVFQFSNAGILFPNCLFPLVGIANFLIFSGKHLLNLLPPSWRPSGYRKARPAKAKPQSPAQPIPFRPKEQPAKKEQAYTHRCTVCGRTDVTNPELEFRYCSRCNGYHCYCEDHISNHTHIE